MTEEKRKFLRFEVFIPVELVKSDGIREDDAEAVLDNISREGMRIILDLDSPFGTGAELNFKVHNPEKRQTFSVTGEVVWSKSTGEKVEIGLKIKAIENSTKAELLDMGYSRWKDDQIHPKKLS